MDEICECPKCGRQHRKLADSPPPAISTPKCPKCGELATHRTPDGTLWDGNAHFWREEPPRTFRDWLVSHQQPPHAGTDTIGWLDPREVLEKFDAAIAATIP